MDGLKARPLPPNLRLEERVVDLSGGRGYRARREGQGVGRVKEEEQKGAAGATAAAAAAAVVALTPEYRRSVACPNEEETNSAAMVTFQVRARGGCAQLTGVNGCGAAYLVRHVGDASVAFTASATGNKYTAPREPIFRARLFRGICSSSATGNVFRTYPDQIFHQ